jgi:predicted DNA-binding transcriptional regulator YafY
VSSKAERLLNLLAVLRETGRPLSAGEIRERVPGYPDSDQAFRRAFERDKASLKEMGVEVSKELVPASPEGIGYRVSKKSSRLPDPGLLPEERAAMAMALSAVSVFAESHEESKEDPSRELLYGAIKIGVDPYTEAQTDATAYLRVPAERLAALVEANLDRAVIEFEYEKADGSRRLRRLEPHGIRCVRDHWYLVARPPDEQQLKVFRIDRITSAIRRVSQPNAFERCGVEEIAEVLQDAPWSIGGGHPRRATIAVEAELSTLAERIFGVEPCGEDSRGRKLFEVKFTWADPIVGAVGTFRDKAEVLGPPDLRSAMQDKLAACAAQVSGKSLSEDARRALELAEQVRADRDWSLPADNSEAYSARRQEAAERARRLVNLVPWLIRNPGVSIDEIASRFGVPRAVLIKDLTMVTLTGVYPYMPSDLVDIEWGEDRVLVRSADYLQNFATLTVEEGVVLYTALKAVSMLPGLSDSPELASGISKLEVALGIGGAGVEVVAEEAALDTLELLRKAIAGRETVRIEYVSFSSETESARDVDPYRLFVYGGRWYLDAYCHSNNEERIFRVSRISDASLTGRQFDAPKSRSDKFGDGTPDTAGERIPGKSGWLIEGIDLELVMPAEVASWFTRNYPTCVVCELDNGWFYAGMKASTITWATKVLFGVADRVVVIAPKAVRNELSRAVKSALGLYAETKT